MKIKLSELSQIIEKVIKEESPYESKEGYFGDEFPEDENNNEVDKSVILSKEISQSIHNIDDSMHYEDFAKAVAYILIEEYGTHNFQPFINVLKKELSKNIV